MNSLNKVLQQPASSVPICHDIQLQVGRCEDHLKDKTPDVARIHRRMSPSLPQSQSGCSMFRVPGHFLQKMTRIGQGGFVDCSCHFLLTYNYDESYKSRKLNVLADITDVVSRNVLFLRKFPALLLLWIYRPLLRTGASECGGRRLISVRPLTSSSSMNVPEKSPMRSKRKKSFTGALEKERRGAEQDIAANGVGCVVTLFRR